MPALPFLRPSLDPAPESPHEEAMMTRISQGSASRRLHLQMRATLSVEELEPRCLLSSAGLLAFAGANDSLADASLDRDNDDADLLGLFPRHRHDMLSAGKGGLRNSLDSGSATVSGNGNVTAGPPSSVMPGRSETDTPNTRVTSLSSSNATGSDSAALFLAASIASARVSPVPTANTNSAGGASPLITT
jgi:hypothetical protein